jgi:hypothetical protein
MSGYDDEDGVGGATDRILAKPFSPAEPVARVDAEPGLARAA